MKHPFPGIVVLLAVVAVTGCDRYPTNSEQKPSRSLAEIKESGELVVATHNSPATWYIGRDGEPTGPEYDLVEAFAAYLGVDAVYTHRKTIGSVLDAVEDAEADLAAAGLTITEQRRSRFRFGPPYLTVTQQVVCRRDQAQPDSLDELVGLDLAVIAESSYVERLETLQSEQLPELEWQALAGTTTETLLRRVWRRELDCTVADSNIVDINRRYYPELIAPMHLSREQQLGWVMPLTRGDLDEAVGDWLETFRDRGRLADWREHYYGFFREFDYVDTRRLMRRVDDRFPPYRTYFRRAASEYDLPFTLLAAQGYQESHWRARARSPTGVRGIMMLTRTTARSLGVTNRLDPRQSIFGGARYMARMKKRFVDAVGEPDRTYLALAAYNVGRAHLHDAQTLARRKGLNPHAWRDIKQVLPLLAQPAYYRDLKYGYARGHEPVRYVQRIREYRHILEKELAD